MNPILKETLPSGSRISIEMPNFNETFKEWIEQRRIITYSVHEMPNIAREIEEKLQEFGYEHWVLKNNHWEHALVPVVV